MIYLSHFLNNQTPKYAGNKSDLHIKKSSCICSGDSSNSLMLNLKNHVGTHIDLPKHFDKYGKVLNDYSPKDWFFNTPQLLDIEISPGKLIDINHLDGKINQDTDFLIIRTGFESQRHLDTYWNNNPGVNKNVGIWLRRNYPKLRSIGFDFISLSSFKHREIGRIAHKEFLSSNYEGAPILIVEDMKLKDLSFQPKKLIVIPILIDNADGAQVTVIAE